MRELKFRAWGIKENKYLKLHSIHLSTSKVIVSYYGVGGGNISRALKDVIIEQYTGLKDKNGKEIYEGDIIRVQNGEYTRLSTEEKTDGSEVVFEGGAFRYLSDTMAKRTMEHLYPYNLEVIGNIHENKELLK